MIERDHLNTVLITSRQEINQGVDRFKQLENEKLTVESNCKALKKSLIEMEEKVQKDDDRRKKIGNELEQLRKNFEIARAEQEKQIQEKTVVQLKNDEFINVYKDKETLKENLVKEIKQQVLKH